MTRYIGWMGAALLLAPGGASVQAQAVTAPIGKPVDHPLVAASPVRTAGAWQKGVERFGESLAGSSLRLRGCEVLDMKLPGNRGIDLVAVKRSPAGILTDIRLIEVKAHYGQGQPRLGQTRVGTQMSRQWLADRLRALRSSGEQGRKLALDIARFRKAEGIALERLGEVHDVNLRTGKYTIRNPISMAERTGSLSIHRLLNNVSSHTTQPASQAWATRHLSQFNQLRQARMGNWLSASTSARALDRVSSTQIILLEEKQALRGARRGLVRAAGRAAFVVAVAMDAYEVYGHVRDYRLGKVSQQEFVVALARSGVGIPGAWAGAKGGAALGAWLGTFGGPWAWATVPAGGVIGGLFGGVAGYFVGSYAGQTAAQAWYSSLDKNVQAQVNRWIQETSNPVGN